ncbi:MAG: V-type ATP synthase subunit E [Spirochaetales bacterium]|nr:MAG: V-type ATP synthase subunit E [Spirochaetales bacterium]
MDVQLKELIDKIKNDGVQTAKKESARIVREAEEQAASIVRKAQEEAETIRSSARADAEKFERSGEEAVRQAGRNLVLTVKDNIQQMFSRVMETETAGAMDASLMGEVVKAAVSALGADKAADFDVLVPEETLNKVEGSLKAALSAQLSAGMEIKPVKGLDAGFRLGRKDGAAFYDFSAAEIAAMLGRYLNPRLSSLLTD